MKIEKFEEPKLLTIQEVADLLGKRKHPICKFEYGDFDNIVEVALESADVALEFTHFCPKSIYGSKWNVCLKKTWKYLSDLEKAKRWYDIERMDVGYGNDYYLEHIEDIYQKQIKIIGIVEEEY